MKQIEKDMLAAIAQTGHVDWRQSNTRVYATGGIVEVYLHGHKIAHRGHVNDTGWHYNLCGWNTPTTRSRLNALGANVSSKAGIPHVLGRPVPVNGWFVSPHASTAIPA